MSLATCNSCEAFIDTDEDPDCCVGIHFICESCRDAMDESIYQQVKERNALINKQTSENPEYKEIFEAINRIIYA